MAEIKSHVIVITDPKNADGNTAKDIAAAIVDCKGVDLEIADNGVVQATVPAGEVADIQKMEGVAYVRPEMTYISDNSKT